MDTRVREPPNLGLYVGCRYIKTNIPIHIPKRTFFNIIFTEY